MKAATIINSVSIICLGVSCILNAVSNEKQNKKIAELETQVAEITKQNADAETTIFAINSAVMLKFATDYPNRTLVAIETNEVEYSLGVFLSQVYSNYENEFKQNNYVSAFYEDEIKIYEVAK